MQIVTGATVVAGGEGVGDAVSVRVGVGDTSGGGESVGEGADKGVAVGCPSVGTTSVGLQAASRTRVRAIVTRDTDFMAYLLSPGHGMVLCCRAARG
jgi:hypothetical protein